jgi:Sec-independent protein translocase protein TatA
MFGIGVQEMVLIAVLCLAIFGPQRTVEVAKELGRFVAGLRGQVEEIKGEISLADYPNPRETVER